MATKIKLTYGKIARGSIKRAVNIISNSRIKIKRQSCPFCKMNSSRKAPSFTTTWAAIWHVCHFHKGETGFEKELKRLYNTAKRNYGTQTGGSRIG